MAVGEAVIELLVGFVKSGLDLGLLLGEWAVHLIEEELQVRIHDASTACEASKVRMRWGGGGGGGR